MSALVSDLQRVVGIELSQQHSTPILDRRVRLPPSAVNLLPFRSGAFVSDGKRLLTLLFRPAEAQRWLAVLALISELNNGVEPESLSADHMALATALRDESYETVLAHLLAYTALRQEAC